MVYLVAFILELSVLFLTSRFIYRALYLFFYKILKNRNAAAVPVFILFMPGVFIHELAHFLAAEILQVKVYDFEVSPKIEGGMLRMGSVQVAKSDIIRRALIGVAPVLAGIGVLFCVLYLYINSTDFSNIFSSSSDIIKSVLVIWVAFFTTNTMFSSKKDIEGLRELLLALTFLGIVAAVTAIILKFNFWDPVFIFMNSSGVVGILGTLTLLFLVPVVINLVVFLLAKLTLKKLI